MNGQHAPRSVLALTLLISILLFIAPAHAVILGYGENFNTTQFRDTPNTTALWDTLTGELKLPPYPLSNVGSYDTASEARYVTVSGNYAYVADWVSGLLILDISDPTAPALVGSYDTPGAAGAIAISGNFAYVADWDMGLQVIDISDPTNPTLTGSYATASEAIGVAVAGDYLYVANRYDGLLVLDISDPTDPTFAGSCDTPDRAYDLAVSGDYAYVADYSSGLQVIDISDPTSPTPAGSYDTSGESWSVAVSGEHAYVADRAAGLQIIDISDPTNPALVGNYGPTWSANRVMISGNHAYLADGGAGLKVVDISDPANPALVSSLDTPGDGQGIAVAGEYVYVADYSSGLQVIRIADPVLPPEAAGYSDASGDMNPLVISGNHAYVGYSSIPGLGILDISDPRNPILVGSYVSAPGLRDIAVEGNYAYLAIGNSSLFEVVDISDPTNPSFAGSLSLGAWAKYVTVQGNYAFVGCDYTSNGFKVIDISDPTNPVLAANPSIQALPIACEGNYAYIGYGDFKTIDISDPTSPVQVGSCATPAHEVQDIVIAGDYAYVADYTSGLQVIDISDPTNPTLAGSFPTPGNGALSVAVDGDRAYLLDNQASVVQLIDISDPTLPTLAATFTSAQNPYQIAVWGDHMYLTTPYAGLQTAQILQRTMNLAANRGQSLDLSPYPDSIMEARLSTSQNDTITWEMSADGGANWQAVTPDGSWNKLAYTGSDFRWRSTHIVPNLSINPTCSSLQFDFMFDYPQLESIEDVPNDQGRQVSITWLRSGNDFVGSATPVSEYAIYRKIDPELALSRTLLEKGADSLDPRLAADGALLAASLPEGDWHFLMTVPALTEDDYAVVVPTLADSTITDGMYSSTFIVIALTDTPGVFFTSPPDEGYSVDNLAPNVPEGFAVAYSAAGGNQLSWESPTDVDFRYCCIYRSTSPGFTPTPADLVQTTTSTEWLDPVSEPLQYYYKVSAVDFAGNESAPTEPQIVTAVNEPVTARKCALYPNVPNPFNPRTTIQFELAYASHATLQVFDLAGRLVTTLLDQPQSAGIHEVVWQGKDSDGRQVATGIYLYQLRAGDYVQTKRMVLLK